MGGLLRTRAALVLGECSYGIYLLHGVVLNLLFVDGRQVLGWLSTESLPFLLPLVALVVVPVTALTFLVFERPAINAGRALVRRWRRVVQRPSPLPASTGPVAPAAKP
jgi:peptidoglycan/LPS O-acetylase OafA/YrhL